MLPFFLHLQLFHKICHISAVTDVSGEFSEHYDSIKPAQISEYNQPLTSLPPSFQVSDEPVQHDDTTLQDKTQHVRFNVYDLRSSDIENGLSMEEYNSLPEVIVLSSDEEEPPKSKRARPLPSTDSNLFPTVEASSIYSHSVGESDLMIAKSPSHHGHEPQNLNDSLEEFEMLPPVCPLGNVQSATSVDQQALVDQHEGAQLQQSMSAFSETHGQYQSAHNGIYGDFSIIFGDQNNSTAISTPSYLKQVSLFNPFRSRSSSNSAVGLLQSTYWDGKTPTQKQIRESVRNSLANFCPKPGSYDPFPPLNNHITNTARMAREFFSGTPPPGFLAGAIVRKTPPSNPDGSHTNPPSESVVQRTPVKSLNLGHEDGKMIRLESDDRAMTMGPGPAPTAANYPHTSTAVIGGTGSHQYSEGIINYGEIKGNYPNINSSGVSERQQTSINRFSDLKAFHQLQHHQPSDYSTYASLPENNNFNPIAGISNNSRHTESLIDDPWLDRGVIGPPARAKVGRLCMYLYHIFWVSVYYL